MHYRLPSTLELVKHSSVVITDDNLHDFHSAECFQKAVDEQLEQTFPLVPDQTIIWSDGCSSQYKSRGPFANISLNSIKIKRDLFKCVKGDCDAEIRQINRAIKIVITGSQVGINDAEGMYDYCSEFLTIDECHTIREFTYIPRNRPGTNVETINHSRKIHQMKDIVNKYVVNVR